MRIANGAMLGLVTLPTGARTVCPGPGTTFDVTARRLAWSADRCVELATTWRLRATLGGSWLYVHGDSSSRGLFLSLFQQVAGVPWPATSSSDLIHIGFADAIVDAATGALLQQHAAPKFGRSGNRYSPDESTRLQPSWSAAAGATTRLRLTYRFLTFTHHFAHDNLRELSLTPRPDTYVLQSGAWDDARHTPPEAYAEQLRTGIEHWRAAAAHRDASPRATSLSRSVARGSPRLVYVTAPTPVRLGDGGDTCGSWHEALWRSDTWQNTTSGVELINRVRSTEELRDASRRAGLCGCVDPRVRSPWGEAMLYHAPHLHNVWDVLRIVAHLYPDASGEGGRHGRSRCSRQPGRRTSGSLRIVQDLGSSALNSSGCCCQRPPGKTHPHPLDMWELPCITHTQPEEV